jgi:hypothetical protein
MMSIAVLGEKRCCRTTSANSSPYRRRYLGG